MQSKTKHRTLPTIDPFQPDTATRLAERINEAIILRNVLEDRENLIRIQSLGTQMLTVRLEDAEKVIAKLQQEINRLTDNTNWMSSAIF